MYIKGLTLQNSVRSNFIDALRKKCPYLKLFWSAFFRIRTEFGEILGKSK